MKIFFVLALIEAGVAIISFACVVAVSFFGSSVEVGLLQGALCFNRLSKSELVLETVCCGDILTASNMIFHFFLT